MQFVPFRPDQATAGCPRLGRSFTSIEFNLRFFAARQAANYTGSFRVPRDSCSYADTVTATGTSLCTASFTAEEGRNYTVQYRDDLLPEVWLSLTNFVGAGGVVTISDPMVNQRRFYRVLVQ